MEPTLKGAVVVEQVGKWWRLREALAYSDDRYSVVAPSGFLTDFASIPRALWNILPPADPAYSAAAIIHDCAYETHVVSRAEADLIFYRAMAIKGTSQWKRWIMWSAVRAFGSHAYSTGPDRQKERKRCFGLLEKVRG